MNFPISKVTLEHHKNTAVMFFVTLLANLLPLLLGSLWKIVTGKWCGLLPFYSSGEFYIYSTSLLGASCYIFYTYKKKNTDRYSVSFIMSTIMAGFAAFFYTVIIVDKPNFAPNILIPTSYGILFITLLIYYYANFTDQRMRTPDVLDREREAINNIMGQLGGSTK